MSPTHDRTRTSQGPVFGHSSPGAMQLMNISTPSIDKTQVIAAQIAVLFELLARATRRGLEAQESILLGERNAAIGALVGLDTLLEEAQAMYRAALVLHRHT